MFVAHILYHICSRRFVVTWVSLAYDDHQKDIFAYMGTCPRQLLSPTVHQVQVYCKNEVTKDLSSVAHDFQNRWFMYRLWQWQGRFFCSPPYMYVPNGDLFLVLTFVHKWDAWVIIPLLSNNEFFYCLTHLSLYNTFPGFIFTTLLHYGFWRMFNFNHLPFFRQA